ncbi:MAG: TonB family protein [Cytophagales bacterium]|nr:TonB family protein [Cytophagales bacterium]
MEAKKNPSKDVHRQSGKFFLIGLTLSVAVVIMAFEWRSEAKATIVCNFNEPIYDGIFQLKQEVREEQPRVKLLKPVPTKPIYNFTPTTAPNEEPTDTGLEEPIVHTLAIDSSFTVEPEEPIFVAPEFNPEPTGGYEAFYKFVGKNLKYPKRAQHTNTQGKVYVEFVIDKSGNVTDLKVIKGIGSGCDEEALRVLALTKWQAGRQRGKPVKVRMTMPVNFILN